MCVYMVVSFVLRRSVVCEAKKKRVKGWIVERQTQQSLLPQLEPTVCGYQCNHDICLLPVATFDYDRFLYYTMFICVCRYDKLDCKSTYKGQRTKERTRFNSRKCLIASDRVTYRVLSVGWIPDVFSHWYLTPPCGVCLLNGKCGVV